MGITLVAAGCSHTQGCAFTKKVTANHLEWASKALAEKYPVKCTSEYITNNLTWMGKLKNHLDIDKIYNFGYGGLGSTTTIRTLWNYCNKVDDLSNHLFIVQPQSVYRNETYYRRDIYNEEDYAIHSRGDHMGHEPDPTYNDNGKGSKIRLTSFKNGMQHSLDKDQELFMNNDIHFFDEDIETYKYFVEISRLQKHIETKGGKFRMLSHFWQPPIWYKSTIDKIENLYWSSYQIGWEKEMQKDVGVIDLMNSLNIIEMRGIPEHTQKNHDEMTLHQCGLLKDDMHYSEIGNERAADCIYENLNNIVRYKVHDGEMMEFTENELQAWKRTPMGLSRYRKEDKYDKDNYIVDTEIDKPITNTKNLI